MTDTTDTTDTTGDQDDYYHRKLIIAAGELPDGVTKVERFVLQQWSSINQKWMDGPGEFYDFLEGAREREAEISDWEHVTDTRVVHRAVIVAERIVGDDAAPSQAG